MVARRSTDFATIGDRERLAETQRQTALPPFLAKSEHLRRLILVLDVLLVALVYCVTILAVPRMWVGQSIDYAAHLGLLPIILASFVISRLVLESKLDLSRYTVRTQVGYIINELIIALAVTMALMFLLKLE